MKQTIQTVADQALQGAVPILVGQHQSEPQVGRKTEMFQDPKNGALYPRNEEFEMTEGLIPVIVTCQGLGKLTIEKAGEMIRKEGDGLLLVQQNVVDANGEETGEVVTAATGLTGGFEDDAAVNSPLRRRVARKAAGAKGDDLAADGILG